MDLKDLTYNIRVHLYHQLIVKLPEQDAILQRIPDMQKAVSNALRDIQITHR